MKQTVAKMTETENGRQQQQGQKHQHIQYQRKPTEAPIT
jgi:hypothetical protein